MVKKRTCIFISGRGSNLKNLIYLSRDKIFPITVSLIICSNKKANGINYAKINKIPYLIIDPKIENFENKILKYLKNYRINFICLAGYMKIISKEIIRNYEKKIINIHPSLLPKYKGLNTFERVLKNKEKKTGCTVHYVNEKLDDGDIIVKKFFYINSNDNVESLRQKTHKLEYNAYREAIIKVFRYANY